MRLIIDGYNLIAHLAKGLPNDIEAAREELVSSLVAYKSLRRAKITVVFDAALSRHSTGSAFPEKGVQCVFTRASQQADEVIKDIARRLGSGATIVTSDMDVARECRRAGAVAVTSAEFASAMEAALYEDAKGAPPDDDDDPSRDAKKGDPKRPSKAQRRKRQRLKKL